MAHSKSSSFPKWTNTEKIWIEFRRASHNNLSYFNAIIRTQLNLIYYYFDFIWRYYSIYNSNNSKRNSKFTKGERFIRKSENSQKENLLLYLAKILTHLRRTEYYQPTIVYGCSVVYLWQQIKRSFIYFLPVFGFIYYIQHYYDYCYYYCCYNLNFRDLPGSLIPFHSILFSFIFALKLLLLLYYLENRVWKIHTRVCIICMHIF